MPTKQCNLGLMEVLGHHCFNKFPCLMNHKGPSMWLPWYNISEPIWLDCTSGRVLNFICHAMKTQCQQNNGLTEVLGHCCFNKFLCLMNHEGPSMWLPWHNIGKPIWLSCIEQLMKLERKGHGYTSAWTLLDRWQSLGIYSAWSYV